MNKTVKPNVREFMEKHDTSEMNTNEFVIKVYHEYYGEIPYSIGPSFESISRCRRYITKTHGIGKRENKTEQKEYIKEYSLNNKI